MYRKNLTIVGKNSSVYLLLKPFLFENFVLTEFGSELALSDLLSVEHHVGQSFIIFSGVVSKNKELLEKLETFHYRLAHKLRNVCNSNIILISSSAVYGNYKSSFSELDDCRPVSNYGCSKRKIEQLYLEKFESNLSMLRLGNVLGLDTVAKIFSERNERDRYLDCRKDYSTPKRTYVDAQILSKAIRYYVSNPKNSNKILNVGRARPQSMHEALNELGLRCNLRVSDSVAKDLTLNTSKLFQILNSEEK